MDQTLTEVTNQLATLRVEIVEAPYASEQATAASRQSSELRQSIIAQFGEDTADAIWTAYRTQSDAMLIARGWEKRDNTWKRKQTWT